MKINDLIKRFASGSCLMLATLLVTAPTALGQGTVMEKAEFEKVVSNGNKALEGKAYRVKVTLETFDDGKILAAESKRSTREFLPPNRRRDVVIFNDRGKERKFESISIGFNSWWRKVDEPWTTSPNRIKPSDFTTAPDVVDSYKLLGKTKLSGVDVTVYEKVETHDHFGTGANATTLIHTERYWVNDEGLFRQAVEEDEIVRTKRHIRSTTVYEYDPKDMKIEAPIK